MLTPKAERKLGSSYRPTAVTLTPEPRHKDLQGKRNKRMCIWPNFFNVLLQNIQATYS